MSCTRLRTEVADGLQAEPVGSRPRHHERVDVLGRRRRERGDAPSIDSRAARRAPTSASADRRLPTHAVERRRRADVLGHELDQAALERRGDELAGIRARRRARPCTRRLQRLAVELGQHGALVEVEGPDGDRVIVQRGRIRRAAVGRTCTPRATAWRGARPRQRVVCSTARPPLGSPFVGPLFHTATARVPAPDRRPPRGSGAFGKVRWRRARGTDGGDHEAVASTPVVRPPPMRRDRRSSPDWSSLGWA